MKDAYTKEKELDLARSIEDPIFFVEKFIKVQHPTKGSVPLELYPFQRRMISAYTNNRFCVSLTARQMGKSCYTQTIIAQDGESIQIGNLIKSKLTIKEKLVEKLESLLFSLVK